jgi:hypothetical protein
MFVKVRNSHPLATGAEGIFGERRFHFCYTVIANRQSINIGKVNIFSYNENSNKPLSQKTNKNVIFLF